MLPYAKTGCLGGPEGCVTASGVESSRIRDKEAAALMPRKNLLGLFADFARFGGDVAVIQRPGYRPETLTYTELYPSARCWRLPLAAQGLAPGDRALLCCPNSPTRVPSFRRIRL